MSLPAVLTQVHGVPASVAVRLFLQVSASSGGIPQGNIFVSLHHSASGATWRALRWNRSRASFVFDGLPTGSFTYRVWTSADCVATGSVSAAEPGEYQEQITLPHVEPRERLEICVRSRLSAWRRHVSASRDKSGSYASLAGELAEGSPGWLLSILLSDLALVGSVTSPLGSLRITSEVWSYLKARASAETNVRILEARARFLTISRCVVFNPQVRARLAPRAPDSGIWSALLRVADTFDAPDLDDVFVWAARVYHPETAAVELFVRAWAERFNGLNNLRSSIPDRSAAHERKTLTLPPPSLPEAPAPVWDPLMAYVSAPVLADIAHVLWATEGAQ